MITVLTSICGGKDELIETQVKGDADWVAYMSKPTISDTWTIEKAYDKFVSPRRNSRVPKILAHQYVTTEYSIWLDGNLSLLIPPEELVKRYLGEHDIAVFKHPTRDCIYDEALECAKRMLDDPETIIEQVKMYEEDGFPKHYGQAENMMVLRRHTKKVEMLNNYWWSEYCRHSVRDQISFMYAVDKVGIRVNMIDVQFEERDKRFFRGDIIEIVPHLSAQHIGNG